MMTVFYFSYLVDTHEFMCMYPVFLSVIHVFLVHNHLWAHHKTSADWCETRFRWDYFPAYLLSICLCAGGSGFPVPLLWAPTAPSTRLNVPWSHALLSLSGAGSHHDTRLPTLLYAARSAAHTIEVCLLSQSPGTVLRPGTDRRPLHR